MYEIQYVKRNLETGALSPLKCKQQYKTRLAAIRHLHNQGYDTYEPGKYYWDGFRDGGSRTVLWYARIVEVPKKG